MHTIVVDLGIALVAIAVAAWLFRPRTGSHTTKAKLPLGFEIEVQTAELGFAVLGIVLISLGAVLPDDSAMAPPPSRKPSDVTESNSIRPNAAQSAPSPAQTAPLTHEQRLEINTNIDILDGIHNFITDFGRVDRAWAETKFNWVDFVKTRRPGFIGIIGQMREVLGDVSSRISGLQDDYREYPDIYALLDQPKTGAALKALKDLSDATAALPDPLPPDFDIILRARVGTVTDEVDAMMARVKDFDNQRTTLLKQLKVRAQQ